MVHPLEAPPVLWPEDQPLWAVDVTWVPQNDGAGRMLVPVGVRVRSFEGAEGQPFRPLPAGLQPVTRGLFKTLPMAALIERSRQGVLETCRGLLATVEKHHDRLGADDCEFCQEVADWANTARWFVAADEAEEPPKRGRPADRDAAFYERVARLYEEAVRGGGEPARKPARYVERRLRESGDIDDMTAPAQVRKFIQKARDLDLLPATQQRRPGWTTGGQR